MYGYDEHPKLLPFILRDTGRARRIASLRASSSDSHRGNATVSHALQTSEQVFISHSW